MKKERVVKIRVIGHHNIMDCIDAGVFSLTAVVQGNNDGGAVRIHCPSVVFIILDNYE